MHIVRKMKSNLYFQWNVTNSCVASHINFYYTCKCISGLIFLLMSISKKNLIKSYYKPFSVDFQKRFKRFIQNVDDSQINKKLIVKASKKCLKIFHISENSGKKFRNLWCEFANKVSTICFKMLMISSN